MEQTVQEVINAVGGSNNISSCTNCMTRLRLTLNDDSNVDRAKVKAISGVFGIIEADEQFQIVLGPGKAQKAADTLNKLVA
ncbi:hypothetical protein CW745_05555 [Psychromonas sp. psych-6C06]|uniref:PTS transporter subunit EIIB n=1 Tax=Psychromonas sp. psych-6C06 TaxID=2058089 RepID=UPI000C330B61|nr:PTS transporter subunit EIIB [Psychromonas sp. psych-6C06]PKF62887.1 hypothetical protein CW745_05555 [Psychromonas sp. psych-6C06]